MKNNFQNRRRNYYIKKDFQRNFILKFCGLVFLGCVISAVIIYVLSASTVTTSFVNSRLTIMSTADYILPMVLLSSIVVIATVGIATVFITLFASHKIAGALYSVEKHVDEVAKGNLKTDFKLRSGDQLKPLAVGLGVMVNNLRLSLNGVKSAVWSLESAIKTQGITPSNELNESLEKLKAKLEAFKT